jgi:hypothetical protein
LPCRAEDDEVTAIAKALPALNKAQSDGIDREYENDRYCARLLPRRGDGRRGACENCVR